MSKLADKIRASLKAAVRDCALLVQRGVKMELNKTATSRDGRSVAHAGGPPGKRTGELGRHVQVDFSGLNDPKGAWSKVGMARLKYAKVQETGLPVITPKAVKFLPIPCNARARALRRKAGAGSLRSLSTKFYVTEAHGQKYLVEVMPKRSKATPAIFRLSKSLKLPARPYFGPVVKRLKPEIDRRLKAAVMGALKK